jgi:HPt (histidine-containing phosphotransfer) domain-containing protein
LAAIREAIVAGNPTALRLAAHTLKGSVQYFGATRVFDLACRLERMGQEGDLRAAAAALDCLETELPRFTDLLARHEQCAEIASPTPSLVHSGKQL